MVRLGAAPSPATNISIICYTRVSATTASRTGSKPCYCATPLAEERPYWEKFFDLLKVQDAHNRKNCRHENGTESWACSDCDCTRRLEQRLAETGESFLKTLADSAETEAR